MNIPNIITFFRLFLIPAFVFVYLFVPTKEGRILASIIFLIAGISDVVDGYIARKYNLITKLGEALDPLADKLLHTTVLFCLWYANSIKLWVLFAFVIIEIVLIIGGIIMMTKVKHIIPAKWYGKATAFLLSASIFVAIVFSDRNNIIVTIMFSITILMSLFAFIRYCIIYDANLKKK